MRERASFTAAMIAVSRSLGRVLPEDARLIDDPYGERFATPFLRFIARHAGWLRPVIEGTVATVQVRTHLLDQALLSFLRQGGQQVLILGAGFDARAWRFAEALRAARVFELDHPATQARKRELMPPNRDVTFVPWDFESQAVDHLPGALAALGHDPTRATFTLWEGVTMYLSEPAVDATVRAVAALSAPGSKLVVTYVERTALERPSLARRLVGRLVARLGEPLRFGFSPSELPAWLSARGFALTHDVSFREGAGLLLPPRYLPAFDPALRVFFADRAA